jgi:hypothetical protein
MQYPGCTGTCTRYNILSWPFFAARIIMPHPGLFLVARACRLGARYNAVYLCLGCTLHLARDPLTIQHEDLFRASRLGHCR